MPPLPAGSQNILPYIESFFVMYEKLHHPGQTSAAGQDSVSDVEEATTSDSNSEQKTFLKDAAFVKFSDKHRKLLNAFIRQNPGLLEKSFSLMLKVPRFIDFDNKRAHFRSKIKHQHDNHHNPLRISVRRAYILEDSYNQLLMRSTQDLKGRLTVNFQSEESPRRDSRSGSSSSRDRHQPSPSPMFVGASTDARLVSPWMGGNTPTGIGFNQNWNMCRTILFSLG